jgi:subtilase family serine protease/subtilisin family serine protease
MLAAAALLISSPVVPVMAQQGLDQPIVPTYVPGQLIIRFQPGVTPDEIAAFFQEYGLTEMDDLDRAPVDAADALKLAFVPVEVNQSFIDTLERDPRVRFAEPNYIVQVNQTAPNDPDFSKLWGLNNTGQTGGTAGADISVLAGWEVTTGSSDVVIVVIDTGVDYTHEDLSANMWVNPKECPQGVGKCVANGEDEDENGYVDDFHGINAVNNSGDPMDDFGHGTHVAGTIGAQGNNNLGVVGVNQEVSMVACKFLSASGGGTVADAVKCFNYVDQLKNQQGINIIATNNSWGGGAPSQALEEAMAGADQPLHICAAGNGNSDAPNYPAAFDLPNILSVAATDHSDLYADFSNYGPTVDLAAPGDAVYSTLPKTNCPLCDPSGYGLLNGTSMATPHVAGAVALIAAKYPTLTLQQIRDRILSGLDPLTDGSKLTVSNGRLNVLNTLEEDNAPPASVSDLQVVSLLMTQVELSWTATGDDGMTGTANRYDVRYSTAPITPENWGQATEATDEPSPQAPGTKESFAVTGLTPNTTYYFALKVIDNVGNVSPLSNIVIGKTSAGTLVFSDDMESGENGWTATGTNDLWHLSEHRANSPTHAWYYGDANTRNYDTGSANSGTLTSPPIELTINADVLLTFYEWSQLEGSDAFDRTRVQLSTDEGTSWTTVFESHGTDDQWVQRSVSLTPYVGTAKSIHVRFWFDTVDNRFNAFEGWYVDDVAVLVAQPGAPGGGGPSQPNLIMLEGNIGLSVPHPVAGDEVTVRAVVLNSGGEDADNVQVQFMDATGTTPVPLGAPQTIANIGVGGSAVVQVELDTTDQVGMQTIQVVVDPFNLLAESNEGDNVAQRTFTVTAQAAPNLVMETSNIAFNPAAPQPGDQVTIHAVVRNDGTVAAEGVLIQVLDVTDPSATVPIGALTTVDLLPAGGVATAEVTYDTTNLSGDRKIKVVVDPQNSVVESDEEDNDAQVTLSMATAPLPNLVIATANVGFDPITPYAGQSVTVVATIFNDGALPAENVTVAFADVTAGSTPVGEPVTIAQIPPGGSALAVVVYETQGLNGDRKLQVTVDPHNLIAEARETDNEVRVTLSIVQPPSVNLAVVAANIAFAPALPVEGDEVVVTAVIRNDGDAASDSLTVQFLDVTASIVLPIGERQTLPGIGPGESATVQVTYPTTGLTGVRRIQVVVDPNNFIPESNEEDNRATQSVTVAPPPLPNLVMLAGNILFVPPQPIAGDVVTITAVAINNGATTANRVIVQFVDVTNGGFVPIGVEQFIDSVPPGGSATAAVTYATRDLAGGRRIQVLLDSNNLIAEQDENDNDATASLTVAPAPLANLVVTANGIGFDPQMPTAGDLVTVTAVVQNQGAAPAHQVVVQLVDVSNGEQMPVGDAVTVPTIAAGGAELVTLRYGLMGDGADGAEGTLQGLPAGERTLRVVVDPSNFVAETDETDNRASTTLTVAPAHAPNLLVLANNLGFLPANPVDGAVVTLTVTILNVGSAPAEAVLVQFVDVTNGAADPIGAKQTIDRIEAGKSATTFVLYETAGKAGDRRIRVVADPHSTLPETVENDNEAVAVLRVAAAAIPNLVIRPDNIGFSQMMVAPGEAVTVTATVLNLGRAPAENVVVQFVDATNNGGVPIGANQVISAIDPGSAATVQMVYLTRGRYGERKIQVIVDPNNLVVEQDENDNRAVASFEVGLPAEANLAISSSNIGFDPAVIGQEGTATVFATIRNNGGLAVGEVQVRFMDVTDGGSVPVGEVQTVPGIGIGASALVQVVYTIPPGTSDRKIQVVVDPNNLIAESSKSDNQATATLSRTGSAQANLVLTKSNVTFAPAMPLVGATVTIRAVVINNGAADAQDVIVQFTDVSEGGSVPVGPQQVIPSLAAGSSATVEVLYTSTARAGSRSIRVAVDPNNFIPESRETDNTTTLTLDILSPDLPNLVMTAPNINFNPIAPTAGSPVVVRAVVLNHGAREAREVTVQFFDVTNGGLTPIGTPQSLAQIAAGGAGTAQVTYHPPAAGERSLQVVVDPNNFIEEQSELDNQAVRALVVAPPPMPNLVALSSNMEFSPAAPQDGNLVTILATVLNNGTAAALDIVVRFDDVTQPDAPLLIGRQRLIDALQPNESATVQVVLDTTGLAGERRIRMSLDPNNAIVESDETDNQALATLTVAPPPAPNLVVRSNNVRFTPASPSDGTPVTITVTVLNEGQRNANRVEVQVQDVTNGTPLPVGDIQIIGGISAGGSGLAQVVYDTTGKEGARLIQVVVDPANLVPETDESDNQVETTLTVGPPSTGPAELPNLVLTPGSVTFTPTLPMPGDVVTLTIALHNDGEGDAVDVVVRVMDETGDEPLQVGDDLIVPTLAASETVTVTAFYPTVDLEGVRTLTVMADPDNAIEESSETDNSTTVTIPLGGSDGDGPGDSPGENPGENPGDGTPAEPVDPDPATSSLPNPNAGERQVGQASGEADALQVQVSAGPVRRADGPTVP